jgi:HPt (histidine-containing phosphotransfer) domain-containing protein
VTAEGADAGDRAESARDALGRLRRWGGDPLARSMVALFREAVDERIGAMRGALASDRRGELAHAAHSLKASCGQIGASAAEATSRELEGAAHAADPAALGRLVARVEAQCRDHLAWLEREIAGAGPP